MKDESEIDPSDPKIFESAEELYHDAPCGYVSFTNTGLIYNLNKTLLNWLGYEREEIIGKFKIQDLFKIGGKIFFETHFFPLIRIQGFANEINFKIQKKDKTTFPALLNVKEIQGKSTNENRYRATIFDITDRKKYEQELINAKLKAEESSHTKAEFLSTISHEIRTPLNAILGIGNLLSKTPLNAKQKEYADVLKMSSENLLGLVNNLLDLSKMEADQVSLDKKPFSISALVDSIVHTFESKCDEKGILLKANIESGTPEYVSGDPIKLNQILVNLLGNAIKFTPEGSINLVVEHEEIDDANTKLRFKVIDSGIGIPDDKLQSIFHEFSQASYNVNLEQGGTGLGLSISQKLLQLHNSHMEVKSELGKGSEFSFEIQYEIYDNSNPQAEQIFENIDKSILDSIKILVVEDNPINIFVISEYLTDWKIKFDSAADGKEAIEAVKKENYDIILMDLHMPKMDGYKASSEIRLLDLESQPTILALSATNRENVQDKIDKAGIDDFISKPFGPDDLYKVLSHYIKKAHDISVEPESQEAQPNAKPTTNLETEKSYDLSRLVKMANNKPGFLKKFVLNTSDSFSGYLEEFDSAVNNKDAEAISALLHKSTMSVYYVQSNKLVKLLEESENLLRDTESKKEVLEAKFKETRSEFKKIINGMRETDINSLLKVKTDNN